MSNDINDDGFSATGLIRQIDRACEDVSFYMETVNGRKISYEDGEALINSLFFARRDIDAAIAKLDDVLDTGAVCL